MAASRTPPVLQSETTECGLAALAILLGHYGTHLTLEELRVEVGSTRMGVSALTLMKIAERHGFSAHLHRMELEELQAARLPLIAYCRFVHFVVVERITRAEVIVNDPCVGPDRVSLDKFSDDFTGMVLTVSPGTADGRRGDALSPPLWLWRRAERRTTDLSRALALTAASTVCTLAFVYFLGRYIDGLAAGAAGWADLSALCLAVAMGMYAGWMRGHGAVAAIGRLARTLSIDSRKRLSRLPAHFFSSRLPGQIVEKLSAPAVLVRQAHALPAGLDMLAVLAACIYALWLHSGIGILICATVVLELAALAARWGHRGATTLAHAEDPLARTGFDAATLAQMEPHLVSGGEAELFSRTAGLHAVALNASIRAALGRIRLDFLRRAIGLTRVGLTLIAGWVVIETHQLSAGAVGQLLALALYVGAAMEGLARLSGYRELRFSVHQLADLESVRPVTVGADEVRTHAAVRLSIENLAWRASHQHPVLFSRLCASLPAGAQLGISGPSLSGKSVLAQLLSGLLEPSEGEVRYDGRLIRQLLEPGAVLVQGHGPIVPATVRENLSLGSRIDDSRISDALADVGLDVELKSRGGLDLTLAQEGGELSGGQRRRLEIARALLRSPPLLVIDEALDGVDVQVEKRIRDAIRRRGITLVVVTGRAESLAQCDAVIRLEQHVPSASVSG